MVGQPRAADGPRNTVFRRGIGSPGSVVYRDDICVSLLDAFPLTRGHLLLIPRLHAQHIEALPPATVAHLVHVGGKFSAAWRERCSACNQSDAQ
ncbi:MAG: HIT family protein [Noviherbaspirillum sp.]